MLLLKNSIKKGKFQQKPWVTKGIQNTIEKKIGSLKSALNVVIVIKIFLIKNIKHIKHLINFPKTK